MDAEITNTLANKDKTNFKGASSFIIETVLTWKPAVKLIVIFPPQVGLNYPFINCADTTKDVSKFSLPYVDLYGGSGINKFNINTFSDDSLHPNDLGGKRYAEMVIDKLNSISYV
ncbi:hypothetical protein SRABI80_03337 [Peribacillus frigoritolerans]|nr:hypothetical protein SRABI80_03337 [Peribacillus frigoritolerans]